MNKNLLFIISCLFLGQITQAATNAVLNNNTSSSWLNYDDDEKFRARIAIKEAPIYPPQEKLVSPNSALISSFDAESDVYTIVYTNENMQLQCHCIKKIQLDRAIEDLQFLKRYHLFTFLSILDAAHRQPLEQCIINKTIFYKQPDISEGDFKIYNELLRVGFFNLRENTTLHLNWIVHLVILCFLENIHDYLELDNNLYQRPD